MNILIFLIILLILVISHEFGHFIVAKLNKIRVDEFSFGFPPKLFGKKIGETSYNFNALPFGGYVKIFGENPDEDSMTGPDSSRSFVNKPRYVQAAVLVAGVVMNLLVAWILLSVGFISGLPTSVGAVPKGAIVENQAVTVTSVLPNSPAEKGGVKTGDKIVSLETKTDSTMLLSSYFSVESVQNFVKKHNGDEVTVSVVRGQEPLDIKVIPEKSSTSENAMIGISMDMIGTLKLPVHRALWEGLKLTWDVTVATVAGFYNLIHDAVIGQADLSTLTGPVGIVGVVGDAAKFGFVYLLSFTALISINLAVINLIPFPALDGGRLFFLLIEKIKGSRIKPKIANVVNAVGFGLLIILMIFVTYHDIIKLL
ncbi:MAG TPA: RIP metalloprotease RseP [Candidatus Paceibacterota bacterium]|nr:RIP metalloprotease RseP [Candidatus Paceibacterota bacterium]